MAKKNKKTWIKKADLKKPKAKPLAERVKSMYGKKNG